MANLYLSSGDNLSGLTFGGNVFGSTGSETVSYTGAATGIVVDQNVEEVKLANATSSYNYLQQGNQLVISSGTTVVATIALQGDANGTLISFANGRVEAKLVAGSPPTITLGGTTVPATTAGPVVPAVIDGSGGTGSQTFNLTAGPDTLTGSGGSDIFNALSVNAAGTAATTLSAFDTLDGGTGEDTLNIYTTGAENTTLPTTFAAKNIEIVNVFNAAGAAALGDVSKYGAELKTFNQIGAAAAVTNLAVGQTAGFKNLDLTAGSVTAAATAVSAAVSLDAVKGTAVTNVVTLGVAGAALNSVTVNGTLAQQTANATAATLALGVTIGKDVQSLAVNSAVATTLTVTEGAGTTKELTAVDASASAGAITYAGTVTGGANVATIKSGAGNDTLTIATATVKDVAATAADETFSALVESGAGKDAVTINTTGDGITTVNTGDGNDTVTLNARGSGKLTVNLGAGDDVFNVTGAAVASGDAIDGGDGKDSLLLQIVGAANIGAFSNFEVFDVKGLDHNLDIDILASKNTVTEIIASGALAGGTDAVLTNVGAGVSYRVTGDMLLADTLTLTQKTGGALTVTLDIDEPATTAAATTTASTAQDAAVIASNATSLKAVFDSSFVDKATGAGDNVANLNLTGTTATSLEVVSGGTNAVNDLDYTSAANKLTAITVTGAQALDLSVAGTNALATVTASAHTGGLTFNLANLKAESAGNLFDGGSVTLGSGADILTAATGATVIGTQKGTVEDQTTAGGADTINFTLATQASDATVGADSVANGKITFGGAGPATLAAAVLIADGLAETAGETAVFEYLGNSYVFNQGAADIVVKLSGTTGLTGLDTYAANSVYVF